MIRATIRREMSSVVGRNGRISTRERSGVSVGPMRFAWTVVVFKMVALRSRRGAECQARVLHELHFGQREQKGKRGFRALIAVDPVHM